MAMETNVNDGTCSVKRNTDKQRYLKYYYSSSKRSFICLYVRSLELKIAIIDKESQETYLLWFIRGYISTGRFIDY